MMTEGEIYCNVSQCGKALHSSAWVTFCSHAICDQDAQQCMNQVPRQCPACGVSLPSKEDVLRVNLDPSEQLKSIMLAGLKPEVIMDICSKGLNFWSYQMERERQKSTHRMEALRGQLCEMEQYYENLLRNHNNEYQNLSRQMQNMRKEITNVLEMKEATSAKLDERTRQYQKLKTLYDSLRHQVPRGAPVAMGNIPQSNQQQLLPYQIPPTVPKLQHQMVIQDDQTFNNQINPGRNLIPVSTNTVERPESFSFAPVQSKGFKTTPFLDFKRSEKANSAKMSETNRMDFK